MTIKHWIISIVHGNNLRVIYSVYKVIRIAL